MGNYILHCQDPYCPGYRSGCLRHNGSAYNALTATERGQMAHDLAAMRRPVKAAREPLFVPRSLQEIMIEKSQVEAASVGLGSPKGVAVRELAKSVVKPRTGWQ
jgi:hypothetical protein